MNIDLPFFFYRGQYGGVEGGCRVHSKFAIHEVVEIPSPQSVDLSRQMLGQCFYVLIREDDGSLFGTADLHQGLRFSGGVETHRDIFGLLGVHEEYAPE